MNGEKVNGHYPAGRLKAIAKQHGTTVGKLKEHVAYWDTALNVEYALEHQAQSAAERWFELDDLCDIRPFTIDEVIPAIPAAARKALRADLRRGIKSIEKMIEALR